MNTNARALIAIGLHGATAVLATDSDTIDFELAEVANSPEDIGLVGRAERDCFPGLYLWTGTARSVTVGTFDCQEQETVYHGELRSVVPEELSGLLAMQPPRVSLWHKRNDPEVTP